MKATEIKINKKVNCIYKKHRLCLGSRKKRVRCGDVFLKDRELTLKMKLVVSEWETGTRDQNLNVDWTEKS